ncbi:MAG: hypothetical protein WCT19_03950 [Candidatus Paceibacterota bacterium]
MDQENNSTSTIWVIIGIVMVILLGYWIYTASYGGYSNTASTTPTGVDYETASTSDDTLTNTDPASLGVKTVTLQDNNDTIGLAVGETFLLKLGENYAWTVTVDDQSIISRALNYLVVKGAQGIYVANNAGNTTLEAVGDPVCRQSTPPCMAPSISFKVNVVVN